MEWLEGRRGKEEEERVFNVLVEINQRFYGRSRIVYMPPNDSQAILSAEADETWG
jgi:uncharacterized protein YrzB (UPF0473 family)